MRMNWRGSGLTVEFECEDEDLKKLRVDFRVRGGWFGEVEKKRMMIRQKEWRLQNSKLQLQFASQHTKPFFHHPTTTD
jgi:hypothetical protein